MLLRIWETLTLSGGQIVGRHDSTLASHAPLRPSQSADLRLAASKMTGATRRAFQAEMALQYCGGNPLLAETIFGGGAVIPLRWAWPRDARGSRASGRKGPSAVATPGKRRNQRPRKPWGGWRKPTRNKPQPSEPP